VSVDFGEVTVIKERLDRFDIGSFSSAWREGSEAIEKDRVVRS
jgi:hypothetical protein